MKLIIDSAIFNQLDLYGALQHIAWRVTRESSWRAWQIGRGTSS